jgi:hypothetical protein
MLFRFSVFAPTRASVAPAETARQILSAALFGPRGSANRRRISKDRFRVVGCRAFCLDFEEGSGGEAGNAAVSSKHAAGLCSAARVGSVIARWDAACKKSAQLKNPVLKIANAKGFAKTDIAKRESALASGLLPASRMTRTQADTCTPYFYMIPLGKPFLFVLGSGRAITE